MEVALEKAHQELEKKVEERTANLKIANEQLQHEISVRTQAEEEIKKTKDYLDNIIESSIDSIIVSDREGGITRFNKAFLKLTGYMEGEVIGKKFYDFIPSEPGTYESTTGELVEIKENYFIDAKRMHEELYEEGKIENRKAYIVRKDGELVPVENNISLLYNEQDAFDGVTIIRNTVLRKKAEKKIFEYQNKLKSLTSQLTLTEERERRRFADYLHDQVGQKLFVSKLKLEALNKSLSSADNTKALGEIYEIIHQMIKDTRSLTSEISPPILYQFGLEAALEWLTEQTTEQYGIIIDFEDDEQEKELNDDMKIFLFQAVRELITNIAKHARAENAKVSIQRDNSHIRICVEDDGVGLTSSYRDVSKAAKEGFGLFSIGERMDHLGGQFEIKSQPDCGTQATLVAPLKGKKEI
jgi:signal transduction histidine kinase